MNNQDKKTIQDKDITQNKKTIQDEDITQDKKITFDDFDKLDLKAEGAELYRIIETGLSSRIGEDSVDGKGSYTISLNADFGQGKTTFLKMFKNYVEDKNKYKVVFINAWRTDFYQTPIIPILFELLDQLSEGEKDEGEKNQLREKIFSILGALVGTLGNQFLKHRTWVDLKELFKSVQDAQKTSKSVQDAQKTSKSVQDAQGRKLLDDYRAHKKAVEEVKKLIQDVMKKQKLLIIVDELERTRPDYAIHFLEDMKHFFDIPNVAFLVAVNRGQMKETVKTLYGQDDEHFDGYYRKFFKYEKDLRDPYSYLEYFINSLIAKVKVNYDNEGAKSYRLKSMHQPARIFKLSLREMESFATIFGHIVGSKDGDQKTIKWTYMDVLPFFISLYLKNQEKVQQIAKEVVSVEDFTAYLKIKKDFISRVGTVYDNPAIYREPDESKVNVFHNARYMYDMILSSFVNMQSSNLNENRKYNGKLVQKSMQELLPLSFQKEEYREGIENVSYHTDAIFNPFKGGFNPLGGQPAQAICREILGYNTEEDIRRRQYIKFSE